MTLTDHARAIETKRDSFTAEPNPVSAAPVTALDRKRASYFGLRMPAAPKAEALTVADPGHSWFTWDDEADAPWSLGPEAEPIAPAAVAARPSRRFEPTPTERTEAAQMFRDDRPGSYFVRSASKSPDVSVYDLINRHEEAASKANDADEFWLANPGNPDAILADELAQDAYLAACEALIEAMATSGLEEIEHDGKAFRILCDPDYDFKLVLAC